MTIAFQISFVFFAYLLGSIPVGYILTRHSTGKNILELGSGNIGSTNVKRIAGKKISVITQLLDMFKGVLPIAIYFFIINNKTLPNFYIYILALASILGHDFSVFLKFKGGKGVNTTMGASVLITPYVVFISVIVYFIVKWRFKYTSLGSIAIAIALPSIQLIIDRNPLTLFYLLICSVLIIILHRKNIKRLITNQEILP